MNELGIWQPCDACEDFICLRHHTHVADCDCPDIDTFLENDEWPYGEPEVTSHGT